MKFHYDVSGADPIIRDMRVYSAASALTAGELMASGPVATAENTGCAITADAAVISNIIGVMNETLAAADTLSVVATGVDKYGKIVINPLAIWLAQYSQLAADDTVTSTTTQKILTGTSVTDHERGWAYVTNVGSTSGGYGNLFQIGASGTTATITAATDYDDNMVATVSGDTFIVLPAPLGADVAGGGINLAANKQNIRGYAGTGAGAAMILENYISSRSHAMEPLRADTHSGYNFSAVAPQFYADVFFPEHLLLGAVANTRVIT